MMTSLYPVDWVYSDGFTALTVGTFDGLHRGHQYVLRQLHEAAIQRRLIPLLVTFFPHPRLVVEKPSPSLRLLTSLAEKEWLLQQMPVRQGVRFDFTPAFSRLSSTQFARLLMERLSPKFILVGYDHHFGRNREGSFETLQREGQRKGVEVLQAAPVMHDGRPISSSRIRKLLSEGRLEAANDLLGYHYLLMGRVVRGDGWGRRIGWPTANLEPLDPFKLIPAPGVYAVRVGWDDRPDRPAMLYIGPIPSFQSDRYTIETHIFDFSGNLYERILRVHFLHYIRPPQRVQTVADLRRMIAEDAHQIRHLFGYSSS